MSPPPQPYGQHTCRAGSLGESVVSTGTAGAGCATGQATNEWRVEAEVAELEASARHPQLRKLIKSVRYAQAS
jgi:hypothetical protein